MKWPIASLLLLLLCSAACTRSASDAKSEDSGLQGIAEEKTPPDQQLVVKGIDISHHCNDVDFSQLKDNEIEFVFCKATEGDDWTDPRFKTYFDKLLEHKILRGAYHFYIVGDDPVEQAKNFFNSVDLGTNDLPPVIDIESMHRHPDPELAKQLKVFLDLLESHYHKRPILYTGIKFWNKHIHKNFSHYPLWVAEYDVDEPTVPEGWESWSIWQKSQNFTIDGFEKPVDFNVFNGSIETLKGLTLPPDPR